MGGGCYPSGMKKTTSAFTIVELLIVIVIIAILATLSIVAYTNIQARARDSQRQQDIKIIAKALELYYIDNSAYPATACSPSCPSPKKINGSWATTADGSWSVLEAALVPKYLTSLPKDPLWSLDTAAAIEGGYNYDIYAGSTSWCGGITGTRMYLLTYRLEATSSYQKEVIGDCSGSQPTYPSSWYFVIKP